MRSRIRCDSGGKETKNAALLCASLHHASDVSDVSDAVHCEQHSRFVAHFAALMGHDGCLRLAIDAGADLNAQDKVCVALVVEVR